MKEPTELSSRAVQPEEWCARCEIALGYGQPDCAECKAWRDNLPKTAQLTLLDDLREAVTLYAGDGVISDAAILTMATEQARIAANCSCGRCPHPTVLKSGRHVHCGVCGARMTEKAWLKLKAAASDRAVHPDDRYFALRDAVTMWAGDGVISDEAVIALATEHATIAERCTCAISDDRTERGVPQLRIVPLLSVQRVEWAYPYGSEEPYIRIADLDKISRPASDRAVKEPDQPTCRVCGGSGFVAQKQFLDDGYGEVDSCPACEPGVAEVSSPARPQLERMRRRVFNYVNAEYNEDDSYAVDIMEDFLKMLGTTRPRTEADFGTPLAEGAVSAAPPHLLNGTTDHLWARIRSLESQVESLASAAPPALEQNKSEKTTKI